MSGVLLFTGGICDKILKIRYSIFVPESKRHFAVASAVYHNIRVVYYVVHVVYVFEVAKRKLREDFWLDSYFMDLFCQSECAYGRKHLFILRVYTHL